MANKSTKELLKQPDEFMSTAGSVFRWIKSNPQKFISGLLVVVVISGSAFGWYGWHVRNESAAMSAFLKTSTDVKQLSEIVNRYSDTKAGKLSNLRLACISYERGNYDDAIKHANEFIDSWGSKDSLFYQSMLIMASGYMSKKEYDKAVAALDKCSVKAPEEIRSQALYYKAMALKDLGKAKEAQEVLTSMTDASARDASEETKKSKTKLPVSVQYREYAKIALADLDTVQR